MTGPGGEMTQRFVIGPDSQIDDETFVVLVPGEPLIQGSWPLVIFQTPDESGARLAEQVDGGEGKDEFGNGVRFRVVYQSADVELREVHSGTMAIRT